jgi:iron(III) transport system permease protein
VEETTHKRAILNTILIGTVGGALTVACYTAIGFATHRRDDGWSRFVDYLVLVPRAIRGCSRASRSSGCSSSSRR